MQCVGAAKLCISTKAINLMELTLAAMHGVIK